MFSRVSLALVCALLSACGGEDVPPEPPAGLPDGWADGVAMAVAEDLDPAPGVVEIALTAQVTALDLVPGGSTEVWTYDGRLPGPLIRARRGDRLVVHFTNELPEATTIHWHGLRVPSDMDGVGAHVPPGGTFEYSFELPDAGTFWYHPHVHAAAQVGFGLYGAIVVEDPDEPAGLGGEAVMVLSDMSIEEDGSLLEPNSGGSLGDIFGREGNVVLVNGRQTATLLARRGIRQRWRLINAARIRYFWLELPGHRFTRIGGDGGLREAPLVEDRILLTPGERADVLVEPLGETGVDIPLRAVPYDRGFTTTGLSPQDLLFVRVVDDVEGAPEPLPARLRTIAAIDPAGALGREVALTQVDGENMLGINGQGHLGDHVVFEGLVGTTERWTVKNETDYAHPFHLHGFFFQPADAAGRAIAPIEWKDTLDVPPNETRRFIVRYDDRPGEWMFHCHILDHAEIGMMGMLHLTRP